jgi:hypothetical protein
MSVATTRSGHTSTTQIPVLTPMYGGQRESFRAVTDGTYRCGSALENEFRLGFSGAETSHCCFAREAGEFSVSRLDGRVWVNDLLVNGKSVLTEGDVVSFGPVSFRLDLLEAPSHTFEPDTHAATNLRSPATVDIRPINSAAVADIVVPTAVAESAVTVSQTFVAAAMAEEKSSITALRSELEEHQALLKMRQQQLDDVAQMVTERERLVNARLDSLETRSEQITTEWKEVRQKQTNLDSLEAALTERSKEVDQICLKLAEQQRLIEVAAEQNAASLAAIEKSRQEIAAREPDLVQREIELKAKAELLAKQQQEVTERANALAEYEPRATATATSGAETRSVAQLAAIAAKHEAAIRERELAQQAQNELQRLEKSVAARQLELAQRQAEIDSRESEISARLLALKSLRNQFRTAQAVAIETASAVSAFGSEPDADAQLLADALRAERAELDRRAAEIVAAEERVSEQMNAALSTALTAESERNALHDSNKDLLCERNSLSQLRQDLASRESGITEREVFVARQLEDIRSRFAVLDLRAAELKQHEGEVNSRAADIHRRVQQFKADRQTDRESSTAKNLAAEDSTETLEIRQQLASLQQTLSTAENDRELMASERDSLLSAVRELQKALMDAHEDLEEANRVKNESVAVGQRLAQTQQDLEDREQSLTSLESKLFLVNEELERARTDVEKAHTEVAVLEDQLNELKMTLAKQVPLHDDIASSIPGVHFNDSESFAQLSRELDQRAELLDQREEALRERDRKIEQAEGEVDSQRRQLLEARQQLELARAEIQVAMRRQSESSSTAASPVNGRVAESDTPDDYRSAISTHRDDSQNVESYKADTNTVFGSPSTDLRSELAGLFGLKKPAAEKFSPPPIPQSEFMDLSEPTGENKAVAFHFGSTDTQLTVPSSQPGSGQEIASETPREENSDDFVRDYMEQLLSRNRKSAGGVLPGELKSADKKNDLLAAPAKANSEKPAAKSAPKVKSFIDQYMAGNMGDLFNGEALTMTGVDSSNRVIEPEVDERPTQPRQKMDLQKLKENMDSFRTLSTQSVENALASHAIKQERMGFSGRTLFAGLLLTMTLFLGIANGYGAINSPMLTWVTLTSAIGILSELYRRYTVIKIHTRSPLDLLFDSNKPKDPTRPEILADADAALHGRSSSATNERLPLSSETEAEVVAEVSDTVSIS